MGRRGRPPEDPVRYLRAGIGERADKEVADEVGVSRERVRQVRAGLGIPMNREARARLISRTARERWQRKWASKARLIRRWAAQGLHQSAIARRLGVSPGAVNNVAGRLGLAIRPFFRPLAFWLALDWNRSNRQIARDAGIPLLAVAYNRRRLRRAGHPIPAAMSFRTRWTADLGRGIDWRRGDAELADELGVSVGRLIQVRTRMRRLGVPVPYRRRGRPRRP